MSFEDLDRKAAEGWGGEQEALIRRNLWLDPRDGETGFEDLAEERLDAVSPRLELNTVAGSSGTRTNPAARTGSGKSVHRHRDPRRQRHEPPRDRVDVDDSGAGERRPAILPTFTFHESRHRNSTCFAEDAIPEVTRRGRRGHKMKGIARSTNR
ncbi:hypothetical protein [Amycolatopsis sp. DSM 110486]|uniref:hypothetical protein n=1 Tax=Amycolatopsis sp. DSM 110486 TaxID=2865832 RepID=UPI002106B5E5|nr:hypothetical protein [Amycolatopsis sp. DSM 110486]